MGRRHQPRHHGTKLDVTSKGDGYGPSDQTSFYAARVRCSIFFTVAHERYHTPDDKQTRSNQGMARRRGVRLETRQRRRGDQSHAAVRARLQHLRRRKETAAVTVLSRQRPRLRSHGGDRRRSEAADVRPAVQRKAGIGEAI